MDMENKKFSFDHDLHIHSHLSSCSSDPEQSTERILQYAKDQGLLELCLTDHYWDSSVPSPSRWYQPQDFAHISLSRPLPIAPKIRFLFGCETEMRADCTLGIPMERFADFDFVIIPTTHLHMTNFTITEADAVSLDARARLWSERLDALLSMHLPFHKIGIPHLACQAFVGNSRADYLATLNRIPSEVMEKLFRKAAALGVGIELNSFDLCFSDAEADTVLRMFRIAKGEGCKFYLGSDAHHPDDFNRTRELFERTIDLLDLKESNKFHI